MSKQPMRSPADVRSAIHNAEFYLREFQRRKQSGKGDLALWDEWITILTTKIAVLNWILGGEAVYPPTEVLELREENDGE